MRLDLSPPPGGRRQWLQSRDHLRQAREEERERALAVGQLDVDAPSVAELSLPEVPRQVRVGVVAELVVASAQRSRSASQMEKPKAEAVVSRV